MVPIALYATTFYGIASPQPALSSACFIALIDTHQGHVLEFVNCFDCDWPVDGE